MSDLAKVSLVDQLRGQAEWENNGYGSGITINLLLSAADRIEAAQVEMPAEQASILANNIELFLDGSEAEQVCAEAYQVVGSLLSDLGQFDTEQGRKILDNLSEHRMIHADVLPWPSFEAAQVVDDAMVAAGVRAMYEGAWTSDEAEVRDILTAALAAKGE